MSSSQQNDTYSNLEDSKDRSKNAGKASEDCNTLGRSVSASTILSSLAGSLRRPGKRRSRISSGHTQWYTIEPSALHAEGKSRDISASMEERLSAERTGDVLSKAASLSKVISASHCLNVDNYRRCRAHSAASLNKGQCNGYRNNRNNSGDSKTISHNNEIQCNLERKSYSDRDSINRGKDSDLGKELLESLQQFNFDFNRIFNIKSGVGGSGGSSTEIGDEFRQVTNATTGRSQNGDVSQEGNDQRSNMNTATDELSLGGGEHLYERTGSKSLICTHIEPEKEGSLGKDKESTSNKSYKSINGCSKEFINQLNMYVSNSQISHKSESSGCHQYKSHQQGRDDLPTHHSQVSRSNKDFNGNEENIEIQTATKEKQQQQQLQQQEQQQQQQQQHTRPQEQQQNQLESPPPFSPSTCKRKISTAFLTPSPGRKASNSRHAHRHVRVGKTTTVLFAVTLAYILSFLPYLTVMVLRSVVKDLEENLSPVGELAYKMCVKSFFINNAINPIIYSFLNQTFRSDARQMLSRWFRGRRQSMHVRAVRAPASQ